MAAAPTPRQRKAVEEMVANGGSKAKALRKAGYSEAVARNPKKVTESQSFQDLCDELGLTDNLLLTALVEDINDKAGNRKAELELGFKVKGHLKDSAKVTDKDGRVLALINMEPANASKRSK